MNYYIRLVRLGFLLTVLSSHALGQSSKKVWRWIDQVCSGPEFGTTAVSAKWGSSPSLSVFGANREQHRIVEDVVSELNEVLQETPLKKIRLLEPNKSAGIRVYFAPIRKFPDLAKKHNFEYVRGNQGYFYVFWSGGYRINRAYVLLASDKLHGARLKHFALEEITQSLGLMNDSSAFSDSIFYSGSSSTEHLSKLVRCDINKA